jgi:hypothetical protein
MTDYTWTIATCEHDIATGGITVAHWRCSAVDGDFTASAYGTCGFTPDASAEGFKPYTDVTEADVLGWVWGSVDKAAAEASLETQIEAQKNPVSASGTPWA